MNFQAERLLIRIPDISWGRGITSFLPQFPLSESKIRRTLKPSLYSLRRSAWISTTRTFYDSSKVLDECDARVGNPRRNPLVERGGARRCSRASFSFHRQHSRALTNSERQKREKTAEDRRSTRRRRREEHVEHESRTGEKRGSVP